MDEGFVINQEGIGLRLTAMEYWKCSKAGIVLPSVDKKEPDCKFVIAESLPEQGNITSVMFQILSCLLKLNNYITRASLYTFTYFRQKSGRHILGAAQGPRNPARWAVHKKHSFYCTCNG